MAQVRRKTFLRTSAAICSVITVTSVCWTQQTPSLPVSSVHAASPESAGADDNRNLKQKALADQAQRLVTMATELKVEVDKTNKNILSLDVVRKAGEIEALAHRMKDQGKK